MSLEPGQIIEGKYKIVRLLGEGGMGAVYECKDESIQKRFAIKVLHASVAENKDAVGRFEKEAQAAGRIGSDHITEVTALGTLPSGDRYMVMEYLDGSTLSDRIKEKGKLTPAELAPITVQLLEGLGAAHDAGIIHRDLKPDNVFLLRSKAGIKDFVKILDFGISKFNRMSGDTAMSMTRTGAVMGTPYYMSPEQAKGSKEIDGKSDLYSVGVILYEAITGQVPFNAETFNELIFKIVLEAPPPPEQFVPDLDPGFSSIIRKAMARDPSQRFATSAEFQQTILQWMQGGGVKMFEESGTTVAARVALGIQEGAPHAAHGQTNAGPAHNEPAPAPARNNTGLIVGVALGAVVLLGGGGLVVMKMNAPPPAATTATATATAEPPPTTSAATPPPTVQIADPPPASAAPPTASAVASAPPATPQGDKGKTGATAGVAGAKTPEKQPDKKGGTGTAGGRKIRTGLD